MVSATVRIVVLLVSTGDMPGNASQCLIGGAFSRRTELRRDALRAFD